MAAKELFQGGASNLLFTDRRNFYLDPQRVAELWPNITPFTTFLMSVGKKKVNDPLYKLFEHESAAVKQEMTIGTSTLIDASQTGDTDSSAITVDTLTGLSSAVDESLVGLMVECWDSTKTTKRGVAIITDVSAGAAGTGTVDLQNAKYSSGTGNDFTTQDGDYLVVIGNVRGEGSVAPEAWADELSIVWNSTQFFSTPIEITGKLYKAAKLRGYSNEIARLRTEKMKEFKMQKEQAMLKSVSTVGTNFGGSDTFTEAYLRTLTDPASSTVKLRTTYGYIPILEDYGNSTDGNENQNVFTITEGAYEYADFVDDCEVIFDKTEGDQRFAFCGRGAMSYWSKLSADKYFAGKSGWNVQLDANRTSKLGFNVRRLETPHGIMHLVATKALRNQYNRYMAIPDHNHVFMCEFEADEFKNNVKTDNDYNGVKDVYNGDQGFGMELIKKHHLIKIN